MTEITLKIKSPNKILALGAELDTTMACCVSDKIFVSENLEDTNNTPGKLEEKITNFLQECHIDKPDYILTDLHPEYNSVKTGAKLAEKWQIPHIKIQHHEAHIFSSIVEHYLEAPLTRGVGGVHQENTTETGFKLVSTDMEIIGIACDGTGYGHDGDIWGGEIMEVKIEKPVLSEVEGSKVKSINRIGHLEPQTLLGGQLAVEEPARVLMAILAKFLNEQELYSVMEKFYDQKILKLFNSQLKQNFNCQTTTSCGRILDAASALLFGCNERKYKHQAAKILEENSSEAYDDIEPVILHGTWNMEHGTDAKNVIEKTNRTPQPPLSGGLVRISNQLEKTKLTEVLESHFDDKTELVGNSESPPDKGGWGVSSGSKTPQILQTTPLFQYLIKNPHKDKHHLSATVHKYLADGLFKIANNYQNRLDNQTSPPDKGRTSPEALSTARGWGALSIKNKNQDKITTTPIIFTGGFANNQIFRKYFENKNVLINKKIPSGDPGISLGQIGCLLLKNQPSK